MAPAEKATYFGYNEGYDPRILRLGTMTFDYANPKTKRPYFHPEVKRLLEEPPMATADERSLCAMSQVHDRSCKLGMGLEGLLDFDTSRSNATYRLVVGKNGSKIELIKPYEFFEEQVLKEDAARLWFKTRLSVANKFHTLYKNVFAAPKIWLLTGIYVIEDAVTYNISSKSSSDGASITVPIPEPTGLSALLGVSMGGKFNFGRDLKGQAITQILGRKVWAAQWQPIEARYIHVKKGEWDEGALGKQLKLLEVMALGTERGNVGEIEVAEVSLVESGDASEYGSFEYPDTGEEAGYDDELWENFECEVDDLLDEMTIS